MSCQYVAFKGEGPMHIRILGCSRRLLTSYILALLLSGALPCGGQITDVTNSTSVPLPGVGHDYIGILSETVDPANGSVSLRIGVPIPPGRGVTTPFSLAYDTQGMYTPVVSGAQATFSATNFGGWSTTFPYVTNENTSYTVPDGQGGRLTCYKYTNFMYFDPQGGRHALGLTTQNPNNDPRCDPSETLNGGDITYRAVVQHQGSVLQTTLADVDGTVYFGDSHLFAEDRNGNELPSYTGSGSGLVDSLGRTTVSLSGFGNTGDTMTVSGLGAPYKFVWGPAPSSFTVDWNLLNSNGASCEANSTFSYTTLTGITSLTLPDSTSYSFAYEPVYGFLNSITFPSGATITYVWIENPEAGAGWFDDTALQPNICVWQFSKPALYSRTVSFDGTTPALVQTFSYSTQWDGITGVWTSKKTTVTTADKIRGTSFTTDYVYQSTSSGEPSQNSPYYGADEQIPAEQTITYNAPGGGVVETVTKSWYNAQQLESEQHTFGTQSSVTTYSYTSQGGQLAQQNDYDFGGALLRSTVINYQAFNNTPIFTSSPTIFDRPCQRVTYDGNNNRVAESDYFYDSGATTAACGAAGSFTPAKVSNPTNHDNVQYGPARAPARGDLTQKTEWGSTGTSLVTTYSYDETGQVLSMIDPCGNGTCSDMTGSAHTTTYSYADSYTVLSGGTNIGYTPSGNTNAYVTAITDPLGHTSNFAYDFNNSQLTVAKDANLRSTTYIYNDLLARPTQANFPDGGQAEYAYSDSAPVSVTSCKLISGTAGAACSPTSPPPGWETNVSMMDGAGHVTQTQLASDPDGVTSTVTSYDGLGRPYTITNPYRYAADTTYGTSTIVYDVLGRTTKVTEPDGSIISTSYSGNQTTVTDETGYQRTSQTDVLGRLTNIWEAPNNTNYDYQTVYTYDALSNLLSVNQTGGSRTRTFTYDSLSRLLCAANPEVQIVTCPSSATGTFPAGAITYTYDLNGNFSSKTAPLPNLAAGNGAVTTNYQYDALNRLTGKTYTPTTLNMPNILLGYDGVALTSCSTPPPSLLDSNPIGRRTSMCDGSGATSWSHDKMGRVLSKQQTQTTSSSATVTEGMVYTYYLDGSVNTLMYPSTNVVTYTVGAAGRMTYLSDPNNNYVGYSQSPATYTPNGILATMTNGHTSTFAGIGTANVYNDRFQPILLSASVAGNAILSLCYDFHLGVAVGAPCNLGANTTGDNGNVFQILNKVDSDRSAVFVYDALNRIQQANTLNTIPPNCWGEVYSIDAWGNLTNISGPSGMTGCNTEGWSNPVSANNQITGWCYDGVGNLLDMGSCISQSHSYVYDAEGHLQSPPAVGVGNSTLAYTYFYDGDGNRVQKCNANPCTSSSTPGTLYWMGEGGEVLDESNRTGTMLEEYVYFSGQRIARRDVGTGNVHYYFSNHLGSASMITDSSGNIQEQTDHYPYGGIAYTSGADPNHYKFTGKERDSESGLDDFDARYYASTMGRFMTPDPLAGHVSDPQTLNRYAYVRNNPLNLTDPTGLDFNLTCSGADTATCHGGLQGTTTTTTDANGNQTSTFAATVISNNSSGGLVDQNGNQYSAAVTGAGVSFTQAGSDQSSLGTFINGSNETNLQATNLPGFSFTFTYSNPAGNVTAGGAFTYSGTSQQAQSALEAAGFHHYSSDEYDILHPSSLTYHAIDFRSAGQPGTGAGSGHFTVHDPWGLANPFTALGPTPGDVHLGEHNNSTPGGFWPHTQEVINTFRDKLGLY
jgi:RHS repeat-associated protein